MQDLVVMSLTGTSRNATHKGFTNMRLIHPDYVGDREEQMFTDNWAKVMGSFDHHRYMGTTGTNSYGT